MCGINPVHGLYGFGGEDGITEFWDPRTRKPVGFLDVGTHVQELTKGYLLLNHSKFSFIRFITERPEVTALRYHFDGLTIALGSSTGQCLLYDLRSK